MKSTPQNEGLFQPGTFGRLLCVSSTTFRKWRTLLDPESPRKRYSLNNFFTYCIFKKLKEDRYIHEDILALYDWRFVFEACERYSSRDLMSFALALVPSTKEVMLMPVKMWESSVDDDLIGFKLESVSQLYKKLLIGDFKPLSSISDDQEIVNFFVREQTAFVNYLNRVKQIRPQPGKVHELVYKAAMRGQ